jgi:phosphoserine phosphatase RsbU/P
MNTDIDLLPCFYFASTDDGTIVQVNEVLCKDTGYVKDELVGKSLDGLFSLSTRIFCQTHLYPLIKMQGYASEIFITLQGKNNIQIPVLINAERKIIQDKAVVVYIGILIKNRKLFEDELIAAKKFAEKTLQENTLLTRLKEELHNNLEQLDQQLNLVKKQNEELRQFNRVITHDLTEPLRKLTIFSNMLLESITDKAVQRKTIERVLHISGKMRLLVSGLQQYIWITETPVFNTPIDLKNLLLLVKQQLKETFKDVEIVIDLQSSQSIEGDWDQLKLLFYNLLENAVLFRKDTFKAEIFISVFNVRLNKFTSVSGKYKYVDFIRIDIKDNGIGFDPQYKEQVFELFKKLHTEDRRGIGLSLCKKIVQNHNGTISVNSKQGIGTTVTILLPYIPFREPANNYN